MKIREQSIGAMQNNKALLKNNVPFIENPVGLKRYISGGEYIGAVVAGLDKISEKMERKLIEEKDNKLKADSLLQNYRIVLGQAKSSDEFESVALSMNEEIKNFFMSSESGKDFWNKHGDKIIENNNLDLEKIRVKKEYDFGKNALKMMLADNQSLLVGADGNKGGLLLEDGVREIENTKFLDDEEKKKYRQGYLKTGIYNLALSDIDGAKEQANKYKLSLGDDFIKSIDELEALKIKQKQTEIVKNERKEFVKRFGNALNLWQQKEKGAILEPEYYVLSKEYEDVGLDVNYNSLKNRLPMSEAYAVVKKMNSGEVLEIDEICSASKALIGAYNNRKMNLDEVSHLQNKLMYSQEEGNSIIDFLDAEVDELVDNIFIKDISARSREAMNIMEEKARLGLLINDAYYDKKMALMTKFNKEGGKITPKVDRIIKKQALNEIKTEFGYMENWGGSLDFAQLKSILKIYYNGNDDNEIWEKFYKKAPFCEDKRGLLKKLAIEQQKIELNYPNFNSWAEVLDADLGENDKFYFRGRLARKA